MDPADLWKRFQEDNWEVEVPDEPDCLRLTALYGFIDSLVTMVAQMDRRIRKLEKKKGGKEKWQQPNTKPKCGKH